MARPGTIRSTRAVEVSIQEVVPVSIPPGSFARRHWAGIDKKITPKAVAVNFLLICPPQFVSMDQTDKVQAVKSTKSYTTVGSQILLIKATAMPRTIFAGDPCKYGKREEFGNNIVSIDSTNL